MHRWRLVGRWIPSVMLSRSPHASYLSFILDFAIVYQSFPIMFYIHVSHIWISNRGSHTAIVHRISVYCILHAITFLPTHRLYQFTSVKGLWRQNLSKFQRLQFNITFTGNMRGRMIVIQTQSRRVMHGTGYTIMACYEPTTQVCILRRRDIVRYTNYLHLHYICRYTRVKRL